MGAEKLLCAISSAINHNLLNEKNKECVSTIKNFSSDVCSNIEIFTKNTTGWARTKNQGKYAARILMSISWLVPRYLNVHKPTELSSIVFQSISRRKNITDSSKSASLFALAHIGSMQPSAVVIYIKEIFALAI